MEKLPMYSSKFVELRRDIEANHLLCIDGEELKIPINDSELNSHLLSLNEKPYEEGTFIVQEYIVEYLSNTLEKRLWANPIIQTITSYRGGTQEKFKYKITDILDEMREAVFFYDYKTNFYNNQKLIQISAFSGSYYIHYRIPIFKHHLPNLFSYLNERIACIEKGNFGELDNFRLFSPLSNHWTLGTASIGNSLLKIDMAISSSRNAIEYAIEDFDDTYINFSIIFGIST